MPKKKSVANIITKWFLILIVGAAGGFLLNYALLPVLAKTDFCQHWPFFRNLSHGTTIINQTQQTTITENLAWQKITEQAIRSLAGIETTLNKKTISVATGFALTNDGLVVVPTDLIAKDRQYSINYNGENFPAIVFSTNPQISLSLLKIDRNNLFVLALADDAQIKLSEPVLLAGLNRDAQQNWLPFVNQGIVSGLPGKNILTTITEKNPMANGSLLINLSGEIIGVNLIDAKQGMITLPASQIKALLEQALKK